jgi:hypothetical protein
MLMLEAGACVSAPLDEDLLRIIDLPRLIGRGANTEGRLAVSRNNEAILLGRFGINEGASSVEVTHLQFEVLPRDVSDIADLPNGRDVAAFSLSAIVHARFDDAEFVRMLRERLRA